MSGVETQFPRNKNALAGPYPVSSEQPLMGARRLYTTYCYCYCYSSSYYSSYSYSYSYSYYYYYYYYYYYQHLTLQVSEMQVVIVGRRW